MADTRINEAVGSGGPLIRTLESSTDARTQLVKIDGGGDGTESIVSTSNPFPVVLPRLGGDAFGRHRVANPETIFDAQSQYDRALKLFYEKTANGGSLTHNADESSVTLSLDGTADGSVIRQSKRYMHYQPGKSQLVMTTFVFGAGTSGATKRAGYFDGENGFFIQQEGDGTISIIKRSNVTGSVVETKVEQSAWSDGTTLDLEKAHIFWVDLEWLGVGTVRTGFVVGGDFILAHQFDHANIGSTTYITTANLPVRWSIDGTATASFKSVCATVISEGGQGKERGLTFCAGTGTTTAACLVNTKTPIMSLRPKATFNSVTNRMEINPLEIAVFASTGSAAYVTVTLEGSLTGASFASADADSGTEFDTAATAISGGNVLSAIYVAAASGGKAFSSAGGVESNNEVYLTLDIDGLNPENITISAAGIGGTANVAAAYQWLEVR